MIEQSQEIFNKVVALKKHRTHNDRIKAFIKMCKQNNYKDDTIVNLVIYYFHVSEQWIKDFYYRLLKHEFNS